MTSTIDTIAAIKPATQQWTRGWMMSARTDERAKELGLRDARHMWIVGRAGVLGDGDADVAAAGLAFLAPGLVRAAWESRPAGLTPQAVADAYTGLVGEWGDAELTRFPEADLARLDELARRVIDAAPAALGAVFAGWRALPVRSSLPARVAMTMQVFREMRGAAHIAAVLAVGLSLLQAILVSPAPAPRTGPPWAEHLGWAAPFEEATDELRLRRQQAEDLTNQILVPYFDVLAPAEIEDLAGLVVGIRDQIAM